MIFKAPEGGFKIQINKTMSKLSNYLKETKEEMKHVTWPTRQQTVVFVVLVIVISVVIASYLGLFDYIFSLGLQSII